jgi:hypothetical protein
MIHINFAIRNPWSNGFFNNIWLSPVIPPFKNKTIELQLYRDSSIVSLSFNWTIRQSHAGLDIELGLLGYCISFNFYDIRHWDDKNNCWEKVNG